METVDLGPLANKPRRTFGDILLRLLTRFVQSRRYERCLNVILGIEVFSVLLYSIPYTYVFKYAIVRTLIKNKWLARLQGFGVYHLLATFLLTSVFVERKKQQKRAVLEHQMLVDCSRSVVDRGDDACEPVELNKDVKLLTMKDKEKAVASMTRLYKSGFGTLLLLFMQRSQTRIRGADMDMLTAVDQGIDERNMLNFTPPPLATIKIFSRAYHSILAPRVFGGDNIPDPKRPGARPIMFVSNHTIMGFDFPILLTWLYENKGIFFRAMADHAHFQIPGNATVMANIVGAVDGTRRNCDLLLQAKEPIFLYPGGARETFKRTTDDKYQLFWEGKYGFCKLAVKHGCDIVPVINYGTEDMVEVVKDLPMGWLPVPFLWGSDRTLPLLMPRQLQKIYFYFAPPISTHEFNGESDNMEILEKVHQMTKASIEEGIDCLGKISQADPDRTSTPISGAVSILANTIRNASKEMPHFVEANM